MPMHKVCSSCGKDLGAIKGTEGTDGLSHGLCKPCSIHFLADVGVSLDEFIEGLEEPVVTISKNEEIGAANAAARQLLKKELNKISGFKGGDVFECEYSLLPGGCGQTFHCSGCVIRNTVMDTLKTGKPHKNIPAFLSHHEPEGSRRIDLLISTEKRGEVVFLSIEDMKEGI